MTNAKKYAMINGKKVLPERRGGRAEVGFLLVGVVCGVLHVQLGNKNEKVKKYWENNYWKDVVCFCIVLVVAQIVSVALQEIRFTVNTPIEMFLEKVFCVLRFVFS